MSRLVFVHGNRKQIFTAAASAAASAVAAECVAEGLDAGLGDTWPRRTLGTAAIFAGALTGWATGDANAGSLAALNAIQNNFGMPSPYPTYEAAPLECVHFTESLPTSIGGVAFEGLNLAMGAAPLVGLVGRTALQTARFGAHMAGSAVRATLPGLRICDVCSRTRRRGRSNPRLG